MHKFAPLSKNVGNSPCVREDGDGGDGGGRGDAGGGGRWTRHPRQRRRRRRCPGRCRSRTTLNLDENNFGPCMYSAVQKKCFSSRNLGQHLLRQSWYKRWALGCVNWRPATKGSQAAGLTQPGALLIANIKCSLYLILRLPRDEGKIVKISNKYTNK